MSAAGEGGRAMKRLATRALAALAPTGALAALASACALALAASAPALAAPATSGSPYEAVAAVIAALEARDREALVAIFGPESEDVILSGETARDRESWSEFLAAYRESHDIGEDADGRMLLSIGFDRWPFPIPLVETAGAWQFDTEAGREELIDRRIGGNELAAIDLLRG